MDKKELTRKESMRKFRIIFKGRDISGKKRYCVEIYLPFSRTWDGDICRDPAWKTICAFESEAESRNFLNELKEGGILGGYGEWVQKVIHEEEIDV